MEQELSTSEQMMYSTVRLRTETGCGTGFFLSFNMDEGVTVPVIVTNRHVVENKTQLTVSFELHLDGADYKNLDVVEVRHNARWILHPQYDLAICFAGPVFCDVEKLTGKAAFHRAITEDLIATNDRLDELTALEEVTMVGYPEGLSDEAHCLPIFRKGYTASHPALDFNGSSVGLMDIAGWWGSSGSPVFIFNTGSYTDRHGNTHLGAGRLLFLGVQFAMPTHNAEGKIIIKDIPTDLASVPITELPMNLAYYVKAKELLWFKQPIRELLSKLSR